MSITLGYKFDLNAYVMIVCLFRLSCGVAIFSGAPMLYCLNLKLLLIY